jgi:hypothetical protein
MPTEFIRDKAGRTDPPQCNDDLGNALGREPWRSRDIKEIVRVPPPASPSGWDVTYD